jgi:dipeptidyl aminopeptidase/acylaminoacyl peptidase
VESTRTLLQTVPAAGGARTAIVGPGQHIFQSVSFSRDGATFVVPASTAQHPNEVFLGTTRDRQLRRLTNHNAFLASVQLGRQETVTYTARDGLRIDGVLIHPVGAQSGVRAPLAVLPHGGPEGIDFDGWGTNALYPAQVLAGAGYAVFRPNYRASGGRGVAFSQGDHRDLGGREFDDVLDGIDFLHEQGIADRNRVGISGTSYGGYFSAWAGTRHADRFRVAIPFAGISNWMSFTGTTDIPLEMAIVHWDLLPWEHPLLMWERSPVAHITRNSTPMIIGHGLVDERVHPEQMIQLHQFLRLQGVESQLVLYPREPHGLLERQHQLDYMGRILGAFDRYVRPMTPTTDQD